MHLQTVARTVQFLSRGRRGGSQLIAERYIGWFRLGWGEQVGTGRAARPPPMSHTAVAMVTLI